MLDRVRNKIFRANRWYDSLAKDRPGFRFWLFFCGFAVPFSACLAFPLPGMIAIIVACFLGLMRVWYFGEAERRRKD